ncbi:hypothetical protein PFISCL1PPCAC_11251, partial [Pristionchus fissidentatus]
SLPLISVQFVHSKCRIPGDVDRSLTGSCYLTLNSHFVRPLDCSEHDRSKQRISNDQCTQSNVREEESDYSLHEINHPAKFRPPVSTTHFDGEIKDQP